MKKHKRPQETKTAAPATQRRSLPPWWPNWWQSVAVLAWLFLVFEVYGPALNGAFVLDDRALPFMDPGAAGRTFFAWINGPRPLLYLSFWTDYRMSGTDPYGYHVTSVLVHFLTSLLMVLITAKLLEWAGVAGRRRA